MFPEMISAQRALMASVLLGIGFGVLVLFLIAHGERKKEKAASQKPAPVVVPVAVPEPPDLSAQDRAKVLGAIRRTNTGDVEIVRTWGPRMIYCTGQKMARCLCCRVIYRNRDQDKDWTRRRGLLFQWPIDRDDLGCGRKRQVPSNQRPTVPVQRLQVRRTR